VKVREKIFVFFLQAGEPADPTGVLGVKCGTREEADIWLERYPADASPMPYLGRSGWNSLTFGEGIPDDEVLEAVDESYQRVVAGIPRKHRPEGWEQG
jgi:predicted DNA-binding protein (MmcQ/YjbR family)